MPRPATHFIPTGWTPCYTASPIIRNTCPTTGLTRTFSSCKRRSEEHTSELQSRLHLVCRLLLEKKNPRPGWPTPRRPSRSSRLVPAHPTSSARYPPVTRLTFWPQTHRPLTSTNESLSAANVSRH